MIIDFNTIPETVVPHFKGGEGEITTRGFFDGKCRIMKAMLKKGCSIGLHRHESNCEVVVILKGEATFSGDGKEEKLISGGVHYCAMGHCHTLINKGEEDLEFLCIVAEHHCRP